MEDHKQFALINGLLMDHELTEILRWLFCPSRYFSIQCLSGDTFIEVSTNYAHTSLCSEMVPGWVQVVEENLLFSILSSLVLLKVVVHGLGPICRIFCSRLMVG